jgi:hypothetical protein
VKGRAIWVARGFVRHKGEEKRDSSHSFGMTEKANTERADINIGHYNTERCRPWKAATAKTEAGTILRQAQDKLCRAPTRSLAGVSEAATRRWEIDSRGAAALWFRVEIRLKSNNLDQKQAQRNVGTLHVRGREERWNVGMSKRRNV